MKVTFSQEAFEEFIDWQHRDKKTFKRIRELITDIQRNGHEGIGKPEQLRHDFTGWWSRRIDREHRLVYRLDETTDTVVVLSCRYHYQ